MRKNFNKEQMEKVTKKVHEQISMITVSSFECDKNWLKFRTMFRIKLQRLSTLSSEKFRNLLETLNSKSFIRPNSSSTLIGRSLSSTSKMEFARTSSLYAHRLSVKKSTGRNRRWSKDSQMSSRFRTEFVIRANLWRF